MPKKTRPHPALLLYLPRFGVKGAKRRQSAESGKTPFRVCTILDSMYVMYECGEDGGCCSEDDSQFDR